jgi:hypothetical protein
MTLTMPARFAHCGDWWVQINRREPKPATETRQIALLWRVTNKCEITFPVSAFGRSRPAADASREVVEHWLLDGLM